MKFSVIIPVYNSERYIHKCLNSILNQTYPNWEAIVIDDGSTDCSYKVLQNYSEQDSRIKLYSQFNQGPGYTRNKGIDLSTGDYVVFIDSDDYVENNYLTELTYIYKSEKPDLIFIDVIQETEKGEIIRYEEISKFEKFTKDQLLRMQITGKLPWGGVRKSANLSIIKKYNIRFNDGIVGEESIYSFDLLRNSEKVVFLNKSLYHYINYPLSQSKKGGFDPWNQVYLNLKNHITDIGEYEMFKSTLNSFYLTSLLIYSYRISVNNKLIESNKIIKNRLKNTKINYNLDYLSLETRVKLLLPFVFFNQFIPIVLISKFIAYFKERKTNETDISIYNKR